MQKPKRKGKKKRSPVRTQAMTALNYEEMIRNDDSNHNLTMLSKRPALIPGTSFFRQLAAAQPAAFAGSGFPGRSRNTFSPRTPNTNKVTSNFFMVCIDVAKLVVQKGRVNHINVWKCNRPS